MINVFSPILKAWSDLLVGISIDSTDVPFFIGDVPALNVPDHYIVARPESETNESNKEAFIKNPVIVIEIVTRFATVINYTFADRIDDQINALLYNSPSSNNLNVSGFQLVGIDGGNGTYLKEDEGSGRPKLWRKVTRYIHQTIQ